MDLDEITAEESRQNYQAWKMDPARTLHPSVSHHPDICPGCMASLEVCTCRMKSLRENNPQ